MKIQILSDIHLEFGDYEVPVTDSDVIVFAGDIHVGDSAIPFFEREMEKHQKPFIYVHGNHEYYNGEINDVISKWKAYSERTSEPFYFLNNEIAEIDGVLFFGATFWTDMDNGNPNVMLQANRGMNDHKIIRFEDDLFTSSDAMKFNESSRNHLQLFVNNPLYAKKVVVTHHSPTMMSVDSHYKGDSLNGAYCNTGLEDLLYDGDISAWIFGHQHCANEIDFDGTKVISNPRGYIGYEVRANEFDGSLCFEI